MHLQKSQVESMMHSPGDYILLSVDKYEIKVMHDTFKNYSVFPIGVQGEHWCRVLINVRCLKSKSNIFIVSLACYNIIFLLFH